MQLEFNTRSRDELIDFGHRLGQVLAATQSEKPWIICLNGGGSGGKGLLALAIDRAFNPARYADGKIAPDMSVDDILEPTPFEKKTVVFNNFTFLTQSTRETFDNRLRYFAEDNPAARVLITSNLERTTEREFDYRSKGLDSDQMDINMYFQYMPGEFERRIRMTAENPHLLDFMNGQKNNLLRGQPAP